MRVYRVQDANNNGPMHYLSKIRNNVRYHTDPGGMQGIQNGKPVNPQIGGTTGRFAWSDLHDVYGFIKFPRGVDEQGYKVVVYDVPDAQCVVYPDGQVMFYYEYATAVDTFLYSETGRKLMEGYC